MIKLENLEPAKFKGILEQVISEEILALSIQVQGQAMANAPTGAMGALRGSIAVSQPVSGGHAREVGTPLEYGSYVEMGTRPHWPPLEPIMEWVKVKLQPQIVSMGVDFSSGRARPTGRVRRLPADAAERRIRQIAFAIQRKIAAKGTQAKEFIRKALEGAGLPYEVEHTETESLYHVDLATWLVSNNGFWQRLEARLS